MAHHLTMSEIDRHHRHLLTAIRTGYDTIAAAAAQGDNVRNLRDDYVHLLKTELIPHAEMEEKTIYQDGAKQPHLSTLVDAMIDEHRRIVQHIEELAQGHGPIAVVAAASRMISLLEAHFDKEDRLLLPALSERGLLAK